MRPIQENDVFHAIAHPARRAILVKLKEGELAATELAGPFQMTFAAISQHLRILEEADLVSVRRDGRFRRYRLQPTPLREVMNWSSEFEIFFNQRLDALGKYLDRKHPAVTPTDNTDQSKRKHRKTTRKK